MNHIIISESQPSFCFSGKNQFLSERWSLMRKEARGKQLATRITTTTQQQQQH
jgi:hypothetical protein